MPKDSTREDFDYLMASLEWPQWLGGGSRLGAFWAALASMGAFCLILLAAISSTELSSTSALYLWRLAGLSLACCQVGAFGWWLNALPALPSISPRVYTADPIGPVIAAIAGGITGDIWRSMGWPSGMGIIVVSVLGTATGLSRLPLKYVGPAIIAAGVAIAFGSFPPGLRAEVLSQEPWLLMALLGSVTPLVGLPMLLARTFKLPKDIAHPWYFYVGASGCAAIGITITAMTLFPIWPFPMLKL